MDPVAATERHPTELLVVLVDELTGSPADIADGHPGGPVGLSASARRLKP
jgi:hypothetical protein